MFRKCVSVRVVVMDAGVNKQFVCFPQHLRPSSVLQGKSRKMRTISQSWTDWYSVCVCVCLGSSRRVGVIYSVISFSQERCTMG